MPDWLVDFIGHFIFWICIPAFLIFSALAPFLFIKKVLKKSFTILNTLCAIIVAIGLLALDIYVLYQGFLILGGIAFCQLHGECQDISIF